jgi:formate dehydrogenase subunit gamma
MPTQAPRAAPEPKYVARFDAHQRLQHIIMLSTFVICAASGLPQKFPDPAASRWWVELLGGIDNVRTIHHTAAYVMLADCIYHALYLVYRVGVQGRLDALRMIPTPKDFQDAANMFLYYLGAREDKPKFDRFTYLEKFDYWAVFWGIAMIGGSGLILLFPVAATRILPGQLLPTAHAIHSDEAVLATGWIFIAHIFYVHLSPRSFPFNTSMFSGRMRRDRYEEEHPLEYERLVGRNGRAAPASPRGAFTGPARQPEIGGGGAHMAGG